MKPNFESYYFNETIYTELFSRKNSTTEATLILHGYPSDQGEKNRDLAEEISQNTTQDTYIIHYPGLGKSKGQFSFSQSIHSSLLFLNNLKERYQKINLVGHSWGGFIALSLLEDLNTDIAHILLISPFLKIPDGIELENLVDIIYTETKSYLEHLEKKQIINDLIEIANNNNFETFRNRIKNSQHKFNIIQALNDLETPASLAREFIVDLPVEYIEVSTDHSFTDSRNILKEFVLKSLIK